MAIGRPMPPLILDDVERETLVRWVRRPKTSQALALRARMILGCAEGRSNTAVGTDLGVSDETVGKWRSRFLERRLDGLSDEPRSGRPRAVTDDDVEHVITLTLETAPRDATHWSTRSMAQRSGLSHNTVSRIWRAFGLQPHRTETFKLSSDPFFIEKVRDVVGLYLNPPDRALVLCVDEKSQIQALDHPRLRGALFSYEFSAYYSPLPHHLSLWPQSVSITNYSCSSSAASLPEVLSRR